MDVTKDDICVSGYSSKVRNVPQAVKEQAYSDYGITHRNPGQYEIDHLISLELGGSNSIRNLWPQSYITKPWNAHVKDALENRLHQEVCSGQTDLKQAQREISGDWIAAYKKRFPNPPGSSGSGGASGGRAAAPSGERFGQRGGRRSKRESLGQPEQRQILASRHGVLRQDKIGQIHDGSGSESGGLRRGERAVKRQ